MPEYEQIVSDKQQHKVNRFVSNEQKGRKVEQ